MEVVAALRYLELDFVDDGNEEILILCPFHQERKPSLSINRGTGLWHCFGCKKGGGLYKLARLLGKQVPSSFGSLSYFGEEKISRPLEIATISSDCTLISKLKINHPARLYLTQTRGFKMATIGLYQVMYDPPKGTIIFPLFSIDGEQVTYQERQFIGGEMWLNPEKKYGSVTQTFFGLPQIKSWGKVLLVEGPFDVMRLHEWNYQALGIQGANFSIAQAKILAEANPQRVLWCLDNDEAGQQGTVIGVKRLRQIAPSIAQYYVELPEGKDPDDMRDEEAGGISVLSWRVSLARRIR
jgi:DNA primase